MSIWVNFLIDSLAFGATFMYGSTGEILSEKAGQLNLGIPGVMCMGGAGGCLVLNLIGKSSLPGFLIVLLGILGSFAMGLLMGLIYSFLTVSLRANQNVTGLAMTTFGVGLMKVIMAKMDDTVYLVGPKQLYRWPFAGRTDALQYLGVMFFLAVIIAPAAGLGGFYYIIDYMASTEAYKSLEGLGWLSVALVIFALWRPHRTIIGSTVFGFLFSCSSYISNLSWITVTMATKPLLKMLPYLFTILVLIFTSIRKKREDQPPQSLGLPYFREDR